MSLEWIWLLELSAVCLCKLSTFPDIVTANACPRPGKVTSMRTSSMTRTRGSTGGHLCKTLNIHNFKQIPFQLLHQLVSENVSAEDNPGSLWLLSSLLRDGQADEVLWPWPGNIFHPELITQYCIVRPLMTTAAWPGWSWSMTSGRGPASAAPPASRLTTRSWWPAPYGRANRPHSHSLNCTRCEMETAVNIDKKRKSFSKMNCAHKIKWLPLRQPIGTWFGDNFVILGASRGREGWLPPSGRVLHVTQREDDHGVRALHPGHLHLHPRRLHRGLGRVLRLHDLRDNRALDRHRHILL